MNARSAARWRAYACPSSPHSIKSTGLAGCTARTASRDSPVNGPAALACTTGFTLPVLINLVLPILPPRILRRHPARASHRLKATRSINDV